MAGGRCWECSEDTHIEWFGELPHVAAAYPRATAAGTGPWLCLRCEAAIYRHYYGCAHRDRARCGECEARKLEEGHGVQAEG